MQETQDEEEVALNSQIPSEAISEDEQQELQMLLNGSKGRYYAQSDQSFEKCYNCGRQGHISKNCPNEQIMRCYFCLGDHRKEKCEGNYCFQCAKIGHRSTNCPHRQDRNCRRCHKKGHLEADCSILINFRDISNRSGEHLKVEKSQLLCLSCGKSGHLECYLKSNETVHNIIKDKLYLKENMTINSIELNFDANMLLEEEKPKVIYSRNQQKRKLNELIHDDVEDRTLEGYHRYTDTENQYYRQNQKRDNDGSKNYRSQSYNQQHYESNNNSHYYDNRNRDRDRNFQPSQLQKRRPDTQWGHSQINKKSGEGYRHRRPGH